MKYLRPPVLSDEHRKRISPGVLPRVLVERRIVWNLIAHLAEAGFVPKCVRHDEDEATPTAETMFAMVFDLDQADCIFVQKSNVSNKNATERGIRFVLGNDGVDCINDWTYGVGDPDGFDAAMNAFDPEQYIDTDLHGGAP